MTEARNWDHEEPCTMIRAVADILLSIDHHAEITPRTMMLLARTLKDAAEQIFPQRDYASEKIIEEGK